MTITRHPGIRDIFQYTWQRSLGSLSLTIVFVCTAIFLLVAMADMLHLVSKRIVFTYLGISYYGVIEQCWYWQFITAPLLHTSIAHLLFNMLALWMLGPNLEEKLGKKGYILLSIISAFPAMMAVLIANWKTGTIVVGYSGVIYGILVAQAIFFPDRRIVIFALFPIKMKYAVLLFAAIEFYLTISPEGTVVSHVSHLFGAAGAFFYLITRKMISNRRQMKHLKKKRTKVLTASRKSRIERTVPKRL